MVKFVSYSRSLTDWQPNCELNRDIKESMNLTNNFDYRMFLQRNAEKLMAQDRAYAYAKNKNVCFCPQCVRLSKK